MFFKRYAMITGFWNLIEYILSKSWKNLGTLTMKIETNFDNGLKVHLLTV